MASGWGMMYGVGRAERSGQEQEVDTAQGLSVRFARAGEMDRGGARTLDLRHGPTNDRNWPHSTTTNASERVLEFVK